MTHASVRFDRAKIKWTEPIVARCRLENQGDEDLEFCNYQVKGGDPAMVLTDVQGRRQFTFGEPAEVWAERPEQKVPSGSTLENLIHSASRFPFPQAGVFDVVARYHWFREGEPVYLDSPPVRIEIEPAPPAHLVLATGSGILDASQVYALWTEAPSGGSSNLWLTSVLGLAPATLGNSLPLGPVPAGARPVLAVPAMRSAPSQVAAWVEGDRLRGYSHARGASQPLAADLPAEGFRIVPPLFQTTSGADALLIRERGDSWELMSAPLGRPDAPLNSAVQPGPVPALGLSVHGPDDLRRTVFLWRTADPAGKPAALFGLSVWRGGEPVPAPQLVTAFRGTMIAQDFALRADGAALGAGLTDEPDEPLRYQLRSWSVTPAGQFARNPSVTLRWDSPSEIRNAVVRVDQRGGALLVWQASDGVWWWAGPDGLAVRMKEELQNMDAPLAIFWVDFIYPGLLYNAPGSGLTIGYLALPPRSMPMVSASLP